MASVHYNIFKRRSRLVSGNYLEIYQQNKIKKKEEKRWYLPGNFIPTFTIGCQYDNRYSFIVCIINKSANENEK